MLHTPQKSPIRPAIRTLEPNGIALVSGTALHDPEIIALWFGESDIATPAFIRDGAKRALDEGKTFYTNARGIAPLREAIRDFHRRTTGAEVALDRITVPGAAMLAVISALQCLIETGDNVVVVSPVWPNIFQAAEICGAEVKFARLADDWHSSPPRWRLDFDSVAAACDARTKAIFIASPGNPTGWIMTRAEQETLLDFARERGIAIISDEVYGTLLYDGRKHAPSFLEIAEPDDAVFVINSFSKPWAMTGWRIGWLVHPASLGRQMWMMSAANNTGATTFAQYGALAALSPEGDAFRAEMLARCRAGKTVVQDWLATQNRIRWIEPEGAFYGFLHVDGLQNSLDFAIRLVREARVGTAPGSAFSYSGDTQADSYIRICFAQDAERIATGLERLGKAVTGL
ncbi:MAG TPA: aminotransferase class I/II-fold pyridoxal phosphate-dependent enzyme [Rhizomicrobium sp.]|jgi:aspartate/methionine/tyrosine aminotransferase|nr:aminotransferase class I/II-fold pyridoxal phosphate-dependent enzyme [Rhizomicrobium sp.]